jgi:SAM-dependent methyltransferase
MLPTTLLPLLAAPGTNEAPRLVVESWSGAEPFSGWLLDRNRQAVARLLNFRFRFIGFDQEAETNAAFHCLKAMSLPPEPLPVALPLDSPRLLHQGDWTLAAGRLHSPGTPGSTLRFSSSAPAVGLRCFTWPNGGIVEVLRNGTPVAELDLYGATAGLPTGVTLENDSGIACEWALRVTGRHHPDAGGTEALLVAVHEHNGPTGLPRPQPPLPPLLDEPALLPPFADWLAGLQPDGVALDIGGPPRRGDDPRLLKLDWQAFDAPHVLADPLKLPFRDASLDLVHANGVINRVADPAGFAREIHRVLKPGGWVLASAMPGQWWRHGGPHLLDLSPAALRLLFAPFRELHLQSGGGIADRTTAMLDWTGSRAAQQPERLAEMLATLRDFEAEARPGAVEPLALWSILQARK